MISIMFFALSGLTLILLIIARITKKPDFMKFMIRRKNDEMDDEYLKRATLSSIVWTVVFFISAIVCYKI